MSRELIQSLLTKVEPQHRSDFRKYIATGEASPEFIEFFGRSPLYQQVESEILAALFSPFAEAIKHADEGSQTVGVGSTADSFKEATA